MDWLELWEVAYRVVLYGVFALMLALGVVSLLQTLSRSGRQWPNVLTGIGALLVGAHLPLYWGRRPQMTPVMVAGMLLTVVASVVKRRWPPGEQQEPTPHPQEPRTEPR